MKVTKLMLAFGTIAMAVASAASSYHVTLSDPAWVGGTQLKAGEYKLEIQDGKATLKMGKSVVEAPVKIETAPSKFDATTVQVNRTNGKAAIEEIHVGGTATKVVFQQAATAGGSE